jgi:hypothetical protein
VEVDRVGPLLSDCVACVIDMNVFITWRQVHVPDSITCAVKLGSFQVPDVVLIGAMGHQGSIVLVHMISPKHEKRPGVALVLQNTCTDDELTRCKWCDQV